MCCREKFCGSNILFFRYLKYVYFVLLYIWSSRQLKKHVLHNFLIENIISVYTKTRSSYSKKRNNNNMYKYKLFNKILNFYCLYTKSITTVVIILHYCFLWVLGNRTPSEDLRQKINHKNSLYTAKPKREYYSHYSCEFNKYLWSRGFVQIIDNKKKKIYILFEGFARTRERHC